MKGNDRHRTGRSVIAGALAIALIALLFACAHVTAPDADAPYEDMAYSSDDYPVEQAPPGWVSEGAMYEVFVRNFGEDGTFAEVEAELARLDELGVKTLWLMPIHPIGEEKRKGPVGSPYSVRDFKDVHPDFGTLEDFESLRDAAHDRDMKIILDWVANHTAHDHPWTENPEWYIQDRDGVPRPPLRFPEWTDIAALDYSREEPREVMTDALRFWVEDMNVDGFRFDYPGDIPMDYWGYITGELLDSNPDLFLLAETADYSFITDGPFHMLYGWGSHFALPQVWHGNETPLDFLRQAKSEVDGAAGNAPMRFTTNHDETSWSLNPVIKYGSDNRGAAEQAVLEAASDDDPLAAVGPDAAVHPDGSKAAAVAQLLLPGLPMIYTAQEIGSVDVDGRLVGAPLDAANDDEAYLFTKSTYSWSDPGEYSARFERFYSALIALRNERDVLRYGDMRIPQDYGRNEELIVYGRDYDGERVLVAVNPRAESTELYLGDWLERTFGDDVDVSQDTWTVRSGVEFDERDDPAVLEQPAGFGAYEWIVVEER